MINRVSNSINTFPKSKGYKTMPVSKCKCHKCGCGQRIKLLPETETWLLSVAPKHFATPDSPTTYEEVREQAKKTGVFFVFDGGSTDTIFSDRKYQYAYRAWHDSIHMAFQLDFSKESELKVAKLQEQLALNAGIDKMDARILRLDLEAHIKYYYAKGEHPEKQIELITDSLRYGVDATVSGTKKYH